MPDGHTSWELVLTREVVQKRGRKLRTYGSYQVYENGVAIKGLEGFICECPGPGDNSSKNKKRVAAGTYDLRTQFGRYKSIGYSTDTNHAGTAPMPAVLLHGTGGRTGILIHPAHPPNLYLSSIGCLNPTSALTAAQDIDFWDSRKRVINIIESLRAFSPNAFEHERSTAIVGATIRIVGEPKAESADADFLNTLSIELSKSTLPPIAELTERIAFCIGIWETNRGGDRPNPRESELDTVAGVHASFATTNQATVPFAIGAIQLHPELRAIATPALTVAELDAANNCAQQVRALLMAVAQAKANGIVDAVFIAKNAALIRDCCLSASDVSLMFRAIDLKKTIDSLNSQVIAKTITLDKAVRSIDPNDALGLGPASLKSYIRKPANWGENRAGWQRKAVMGLSKQIGARIQSVAVSDNGTALIMPDTRLKIADALSHSPAITEKQLVTDVAQQNNPGEAGYGANVFKIYKRLYL